MPAHLLFGFHAVTVRLKIAPQTLRELHFDPSRRDARMRHFLERARAAGANLVESDDAQLTRLARNPRHQGVVARVDPLPQRHSIDELLEDLEAAGGTPLLLVLDGVSSKRYFKFQIADCK